MRACLPLILVFSLGVSACGGSSVRTVERTGFVPGPRLPSRFGRPLNEGEIRIAGELSPVYPSVEEASATNDEDPSLLIPQAHMGGSVYFAPVDGFEFGHHLNYSQSRWASPSSSDVRRPEGTQDIWMFGLGLRINARASDLVTLSLLGGIDLAESNNTDFVASDGSIVSGGQFNFLGSGMVQVNLDPLAWLSVYGGVGVGQGLTNRRRETEEVGRDIDAPPDFISYAYFPVAVGAEIHSDVVYFAADLLYPLEGEDELSLGPAVNLKLGFRLQLWTPQHPLGPRLNENQSR